LIRAISFIVLSSLIGVIVVLLIIFLTGCSVNRTQLESVRFSGDHSTSSIRGMWVICYQSRQRAFPTIPPPFHWGHCDCLVDKSRETFSSSDYNKVKEDNLTSFFRDASIECDLELSNSPKSVRLSIKQL